MKRKRVFKFGSLAILLALIILFFGSSKLTGNRTHNCHWSDISCNLYFQKYTEILTEETWGQAGIVAYQAAARWMYANNGSGRALDDLQKQYLRIYFGDLVDRVAIAYNAKLMDGWLYADFKIDIGQVDAIAQTYCDRIYLEGSYKSGDPVQLALLAHELVHARQCESLGGETQFGYAYFKEFRRAGQSYKDNKLEIEAKDFQKQFAGWLTHQLATDEVAPEEG
ncbi:DUF4157 domain-containing protein [Scytonema millei VB511283]|uniref:DUF4157 domain-containing protein n=1 Tax=Scytonema millei VB511283 TaxID=1245923 RepID=A0A9X5I730_9CYAN|nr:DUF4157 domain-containing protein [Scytonema millei VB511283]